MGAIRRFVAPGGFGLVAMSASGCGTIPELAGSMPSIVRAQNEPRTPLASLDQRPTWLANGSTPPSAGALPSPDSLSNLSSAQEPAITPVPHVEEERSPPNSSVMELAPSVQPIPVVVDGEPQWKPAGEVRPR